MGICLQKYFSIDAPTGDLMRKIWPKISAAIGLQWVICVPDNPLKHWLRCVIVWVHNTMKLKRNKLPLTSHRYSMYLIYNVSVYIILYLWRRQFAGSFCRWAWLKRVESIKTSCHFSLSVRLNYEISFFLSCYWFIHCQKIFIEQCPCVCYGACVCACACVRAHQYQIAKWMPNNRNVPNLARKFNRACWQLRTREK